MPDQHFMPHYSAEDFSAPVKECDIVMKGGVTSGLVYPYAILELARTYRFRSIGGTSAGAIAAAFAAAAEYSRSVRGDPAGFVRLQTQCDALPRLLPELFQPAPRFRSFMAYLLRAQSGGGAGPWVWGLPIAFPLLSLIGLLVGAALMWLLGGGIAGAALGALVASTGLILFKVARLVLHHLPAAGFGLCPGLRQPGQNAPGLTDWLHESIQLIAFGDQAGQADPLTFGDLFSGEATDPAIDLRMITTNLSMRRPHTLPSLGVSVAFVPDEWKSLFPDSVISFLDRRTRPFPRLAGTRGFPRPEDLPVLVATRMSLSFPLLFTAVPAYVRDLATYAISRATGTPKARISKARLWFADGGISSNFPIHMFDALFPSRPTFALSLDALPPGIREDGERVIIPQRAGQGVGLSVRPISGVSGLLGAVMGSAKDWQDQLLSTMPGQRERVARVFLSKEEGGLNLAMPEERSLDLMGYGLTVGRSFAGGALDFDEHRWRRSLVVYDQLERTVAGADKVWTAGFGDWLAQYAEHPESYRGVTKTERGRIHARLDAFAGLATPFHPVIKNKSAKFPRPAGRFRIVPNF